ncbi:NAD-dependent epimerase/dehydratase family protein [Halorientalis brevis]|uniref:NAD-dependent epimerase/dehydratase family protein n=1 Tax=Halorientalis brevis TaxID=1126241 RepID=A0ABD6CAW9_9EURY|nr:NAD-dependent epimerase/dehydratase family protein [Halorientalis brevis]
MVHALVIGGTGFVGRHAVAELREHGYEVTAFSRGQSEVPFTDEAVTHLRGDRTDERELADAAQAADPDVVVDCAAFHPGEVRTATRLFADADAYVYVSSGAAYAEEEIPKREGETSLHDCAAEEARNASAATYGPRKAAGDRAVFDAADEGVRAMSVRPSNVYGPHDYSGYLDYWIDRVEHCDRVLVPGDGTNIWHRAYVEDVASALRIVAERGAPGEAYNVADRRATTLGRLVEQVAAAVGTEIERVYAGPYELDAVDVDPGEFPYYRDEPHLLATEKLAALGWESTPLRDALEATIAEYRESERDGSDHGPDRQAANRLRQRVTSR